MESSPNDELILAYIRRVNLDVMWSREGSTVGNNLSNLRKGRRMSEELGLKPQPLVMGPWPMSDLVGFQVAIEMLRASQKPGKNSSNYSQFDTIRKMRTAYSIAHDSSAAGHVERDTFKGEMGQVLAITKGKTDSLFFRKFVVGLEKRMGRFVIQNLGISHQVFNEILWRYEEELKLDLDPTRAREVVMFGTGFVILYTAALRGGELFLMESKEFCSRIHDGKKNSEEPHVVAPFMGRFKGETGERNVMFCLSNTTSSGIEVRLWCERLARLLMKEYKHLSLGPAFCEKNGQVLRSTDFDEELQRILLQIQCERPDLIDSSVDVESRFFIFRSFRRGASTRASVLKVDQRIIDMNNRWRKFQNRAGGLPNMSMGETYTEYSQALGMRVGFSKSL